MSKKIIAIGGGENGRKIDDTHFLPYETKKIDLEIIKLTKKSKPNFLFIVHSQSESLEIQENYFQTMKKIYGDMFKCNCRDLKSNELDNYDIVKEKIDWADIIYEGGGDTQSMIRLWQETGFDKVLYKAWEAGKVISGISAGAVCWFKSCNSDSEFSNQFDVINCLNWFGLFVTPHCDEDGRYESTKQQLKKNGEIGILLSNKSAIEVIDDKFRIIFSDYDTSNSPYVIKAYWDNGVFKQKYLTNVSEFLPISELFSKDV